MSWWAQSLMNSLRGGDDEEFDEDDDGEDESDRIIDSGNEKSHIGSPPGAQEEGEAEGEEEEGGTPTRGVKEDISELTKTLTRQFWGVASFLAPAPVGSETAGDRTAADQPDAAAAMVEAVVSPRIDGIRSDFAEIGGKFRIGIESVLSHTKAVSEISKMASSFLPFGSDEEDGEDDGVGVGAVGLNEEVLAFARNVAMHPRTWLDFPLPQGEKTSDDFEMSVAQLEHALAIERLAPEFAALRTALCPSQMSDGCFWKIYFVLLHSRLNRHDAELLSSPQVVEARAMLLQDLQTQVKPGSQSLGREASSGKDDVTTIPIEENVTGPSSTVNVTLAPTSISSREPVVSDSTKDRTFETIPTASMEDIETEKHPIQSVTDPVEDVETEKHPVQTTELQIVDKSVIEEEPANQSNSKDISSQTSKDIVQMYEEDGDEWLEDDSGEASTAGGVAVIPLEQEEDVSFSDLEVSDDEDDRVPTTNSKIISSHTKDSTDWVQLNKGSGGSIKDDNSSGLKTKGSNDWLDIEDFDVE
ncbi:hypothetical protein Cni_G05780 [Canna indica]|uniref:BSD domain-containing protein n=1 Tax=Canna indica TaxID=4628 RepID=A0AAQ3Q5Q3_9LILI|nr:hypothetical protein Cni_G05780 [Canna indica]